MSSKNKGRKKARQAVDDPNNRLIADNRRGKRNYELGDFLEAGLVLQGTEVKSCRANRVQLNDAYVEVKDGEAWLVNSHIDEYGHQGNFLNHTPTRKRKLLLHTKEILRLGVRINEKGFSAIPAKLYFKDGRVKVQIGVGRGRKDHDKRDLVKKRESDREIRRALKRG